MSSPRVWFSKYFVFTVYLHTKGFYSIVTGASSGLGRSMAELILKKGEIAVTTARKPETLDDLKSAYSPSQLLILKLDVTKLQDIKDAFSTAKATFGRIDVVFNNAGYSLAGEIEGTPEADARALFDTNFWGAVNVGKEAVGFFRDENKPAGGLLLNVSSVLGIHSVPSAGFYSASKHGTVFALCKLK